MKKVLLVVLVLTLTSLAGILNYKYDGEYRNRYDYFTNITWERINNDKKEYVYFSNDGEYEYYYEGGKLIAETEKCTKYRYDENKNIITLLCENENIEITLVAYDKDTLALNYNGKIKEFNR